MKRGVILRGSRRMLLFLSGVARILPCVALIIVPLGTLWVSRSTGADGFFVPTRLHVLLVLTPAISAIATLFGWRRLRMSDDPMASGLLVKRTTKAVRRNQEDVRDVIGLLQGVALAVSAAYALLLLGILLGAGKTKTFYPVGPEPVIFLLDILEEIPAIPFLSLLFLIVYVSFPFSLVVLVAAPPVGICLFALFRIFGFFLLMEVHTAVLVWLFGVLFCSLFFALLPPYFCALGVAFVRRFMLRGQDSRERFFSRSLLAGLCVGSLLIVVAEAPRTVTRYVISEHRTAGAPLAITPLRYLADWETLISVAEGQDKAIFFGALPHLSIFGKSSPQLAREAIARLTGEEPTLVTDPNLPTNGQQVRR